MKTSEGVIKFLSVANPDVDSNYVPIQLRNAFVGISWYASDRVTGGPTRLLPFSCNKFLSPRRLLSLTYYRLLYKTVAIFGNVC